MSFKLLAIRPLEGCEKNVLNNLEIGAFYFFDNEYEANTELNYIRKKKEYNTLSSNFYYRRESNSETKLETINIQAIVGKNGSGKSSIVEFLLRLLNNFFKSIDSRRKLNNLIFVEGIVGELYILHQNEICKIYLNFAITKRKERSNERNQYRKYIRITKLPNNNYEAGFTDEHIADNFTNDGNINYEQDIKVEGDPFLIDDYFFTMYINYSLYGLDSFDFLKDSSKIGREENESGKKVPVKLSWIDRVLHKNDGYQTPLVIHPYRENAAINVRREKELMWQRLSSLIFSNPEYRSVLPEIEITNIHFIPKESPFENYIKEIFRDQNKDLSFDFVKYRYSSEEETENSLLTIINYLDRWLTNNNSFLENIKVTISMDNGRSNTSGVTYDLSYYILAVYAYIKKINIYSSDITNNNAKNVKISFDGYYRSMLLSRENVKYQVLEKIQKDKDPLFRKVLDSTENMNFETLINIIQLSMSLDFYLNKFRVSEQQVYSELNNQKKYLKKDLFWYCVVKSVKILKYKTHQDFMGFFEFDHFFIKSANNLDKLGFDYFNYISSEDKSHITDKLRKAISLYTLVNNPQTGHIMKDGIYTDFSTNQLVQYYDNIIKESDSALKTPYDNDILIKDLKVLAKLIENTWEVIKKENIELLDLLPPPIFKYEIYSKDIKDNKEIPFSKISSGQFQKLGLLSSIVYHLKNIDSIQDVSNLYSYKNVSIILDEIELYFHPEQQRTFIEDLIYLLKSNKFKKIAHLNIFFITHSPFILSDIPSQNVLKLDKGKSTNSGVNSFGANIHDLLADEFFLDRGSKGAYIDSVINKFMIFYYESKLKILKNVKDDFSQINMELVEYEKIFKLIGDPVLKKILENNIEKLNSLILNETI